MLYGNDEGSWCAFVVCLLGVAFILLTKSKLGWIILAVIGIMGEIEL